MAAIMRRGPQGLPPWKSPLLTGTVIQTVGGKGNDGLAFAVVGGE
jgi:hypothetical protein